jgi:hypothetical protein
MICRFGTLAGLAISSLTLAEPSPPSHDGIAGAIVQLHAEVQPSAGGEDAWRIYEQLRERYSKSVLFVKVPEGDNDYSLRNLDELNSGDWGDPRHAELLLLLEVHRPTLAILDEAAMRSACIFPIEFGADGTVSIFSTFRVMQSAKQINLAAMREAANRADWDEVERRLRTGLRMAEHQARSPVMIGSLMGHVVATLHTREAATLATELPMPGLVARRLASIIESNDVNRAVPIGWPIEGERLNAVAMLASIAEDQAEAETLDEFEDDEEWDEGEWDDAEHVAPDEPEADAEGGEDSGDDGLKAFAESMASAWNAMEVPITEETFAQQDAAFDELARWAQLPPMVRFSKRIEWPEDRHSLVTLSGEAFEKFLLDRDRLAIVRQGHALGLRLASLKSGIGRWPTSLDELGPTVNTRDPVFGEVYEYAPPTEPDALPTLRIPNSLPVYPPSGEAQRQLLQPRMRMYEDLRREREGAR